MTNYNTIILLQVSRGEVRPDHSLMITSVTKEDAGLYTCKATNDEGSHTIRVRVLIRHLCS